MDIDKDIYEDSDDNQDDNEPLIIHEMYKQVVYQPSNPTIQTLYENYKDGDLILDPDFQRNFVWDKAKASDLIESILLNIPLPLLFTAQVGDVEEVVDGQQRLRSIFSFMDGIFPDHSVFKLRKNLKILGKEIGGKTFKELDKKYQREIKKRSLPLITISEQSQEDVKFEMFERINTKITSLSAQEIRNCLFRGPYNSFLKRLAEYPDFQYILNREDISIRMRDIELVLMFFAFYHKAPDTYNTNLKQMLNMEMKNNQRLSENEMVELERLFKKSVRLVKHVFGQNAFNIYEMDLKEKKGQYKKAFNQGLYQILMYWFIPYTENQIIPYTDLINEELISLFVHNNDFVSTLTGAGTNALIKLRKKFDIWGNTIKGIMNYPRNEPRAFSFVMKRDLWIDNQICAICSQKIATVDDSEVDHIVCYWQGGKTIPENAQLVHRICNRIKSGGSNAISTFNNLRFHQENNNLSNYPNSDYPVEQKHILKSDSKDASYTVDKHLSEMNHNKRAFIAKIRSWVIGLGSDVKEIAQKTQIKYQNNRKGFVWLDIRSNNIRVFLKKADYSDIDIYKKVKYSKEKLFDKQGYPELKLYENELDDNHLSYLKNMICRSYKI